MIDYGYGIQNEEVNHIFQPFQRGYSSQIKDNIPRGAGIGLTIAKLLIENDLDGSIKLLYSGDGSTCFKITIPANCEMLGTE